MRKDTYLKIGLVQALKKGISPDLVYVTIIPTKTWSAKLPAVAHGSPGSKGTVQHPPKSLMWPPITTNH